MTDECEIRNTVRTTIIDSFLTLAEGETLRDDDDLLLMLDSLQILRMLIGFESRFEVKIEDGDLTPENIGSVTRLAATIARKRASGQPAHAVVS